MYTSMQFNSGGVNEISFSEIVNKDKMFIFGRHAAHGISYSFQFEFTEKEMRELRSHLTRQIRKLKKNG